MDVIVKMMTLGELVLCFLGLTRAFEMQLHKVKSQLLALKDQTQIGFGGSECLMFLSNLQK